MKTKSHTLIISLLCILLIISALNISIAVYQYKMIDNTYSKLQKQYIEPIIPTVKNSSTTNSDPPETHEETPEYVVPISIDFDALKSENSDIVGWLYCEGTPINYPVVQGQDNNYYLRRDLNGNYLISGTLFADYRCTEINARQNYIIYGHNMDNDTMFGTLVKYKNQSYYDMHPILYYLTPDNIYIIELFAGYVTKAGSEAYQICFYTNEEFKLFVDGTKEKSTFDSNVDINSTDSIITLSTCSYEFNDARYVLLGKICKAHRK